MLPILHPVPAAIQPGPGQSPLPLPVVPEVIPVPGTAGGARPGARGAAGDAGEALRVPGVRQEVLEGGGPVGSQENSFGEEVGPLFVVFQFLHLFLSTFHETFFPNNHNYRFPSLRRRDDVKQFRTFEPLATYISCL